MYFSVGHVLVVAFCLAVIVVQGDMTVNEPSQTQEKDLKERANIPHVNIKENEIENTFQNSPPNKLTDQVMEKQKGGVKGQMDSGQLEELLYQMEPRMIQAEMHNFRRCYDGPERRKCFDLCPNGSRTPTVHCSVYKEDGENPIFLDTKFVGQYKRLVYCSCARKNGLSTQFKDLYSCVPTSNFACATACGEIRESYLCDRDEDHIKKFCVCQVRLSNEIVT